MKWRWYEIIRKKNSRFTQHKVDANTLQIRLIHTLRLSITGQRQIELRKSERLLWHFVSSRVNQLIFFYFFGFLFVLRISISEFQHFKRCSEQQNPRYAYTELTEENKNRDFLFSYDRSIFFSLVFLCLICLQFSNEEVSLFTTLYTSLQLNTELFGSRGRLNVCDFMVRWYWFHCMRMYWCDHHTSAHRNIETIEYTSAHPSSDGIDTI